VSGPITVYCTLRNGGGAEIEHGQVTAHTVPAATAAASAWGIGRLLKSDDPNAYVEHVWTTSKPS
jgi:hypothetical protein